MTKKYCVLFAHFNISSKPNLNLLSFLNLANLSNADLKIISNSKIDVTHRIPYLYQPESFFDFGMWRDFFCNINWKVHDYERIVLVNCSVKLQNKDFLRALDTADPHAAVGTILNTEFFPHLQSFYVALTPEQLDLIREPVFGQPVLNTKHNKALEDLSRESSVNRRRAAFLRAHRPRRFSSRNPAKLHLIHECEIGMSRCLVENGFKLQAEMYQMRSMGRDELMAIQRPPNIAELMRVNPYSFCKRYGYY